MRGTDETSGSLFSYVDLEDRIPARHPLRKIRQVVNDALITLDGEFAAIYADFGRPSIAPERLWTCHAKVPVSQLMLGSPSLESQGTFPAKG
ncbi:hypothetical protein IMCC21224_11969 [Puniceibacterium sp. IMCC21224]|nr:hypothetical protein IMCC21224_11969 [Puniceibacterium sp. IMCC21224]